MVTNLVLNALLIFILRIADVSIGTLRVNVLVRGFRGPAVALSFVESLIWLSATARVITELDNPYNILGFAAGYATGTLVGCIINDWLALGKTLMRVVIPAGQREVITALRDAGCTVTAMNAAGRDGDVSIAFSVIPKKRSRKLLEIIQETNPNAFVTFEEVRTADRALLPSGFPPRQAMWRALRPRV
ncbi:MAG TPA: DUF5698 domain-containing protein [Trueperaceae bacterium]